MRNRDRVSVHRSHPGAVRGTDVRRQLVSEEVEVDPCPGPAAFATAEHPGVEGARRREIGYWEGQVERRAAHFTNSRKFGSFRSFSSALASVSLMYASFSSGAGARSTLRVPETPVLAA